MSSFAKDILYKVLPLSESVDKSLCDIVFCVQLPSISNNKRPESSFFVKDNRACLSRAIFQIIAFQSDQKQLYLLHLAKSFYYLCCTISDKLNSRQTAHHPHLLRELL